MIRRLQEITLDYLKWAAGAIGFSVLVFATIAFTRASSPLPAALLLWAECLVSAAIVVYGFVYEKQTIKRLVDMLLSVFLLLWCFPLLLLIAIIIKLDSPGPVLLKSVRVGRGGRRFLMLKFRSMHWAVDPAPYSPATAGSHVFKLRQDSRITPLGAFLRRCHLDELPQLWNVLTGEMSLFGPRPLLDNKVIEPSTSRTDEGSDITPGVIDLAGAFNLGNGSKFSASSAEQNFETYVH